MAPFTKLRRVTFFIGAGDKRFENPKGSYPTAAVSIKGKSRTEPFLIDSRTPRIQPSLARAWIALRSIREFRLRLRQQERKGESGDKEEERDACPRVGKTGRCRYRACASARDDGRRDPGE